MKRLFIKKIAPVIFITCISSFAFAQSEILPFVNSITKQHLIQHVYTLASDSLEGRNTGKHGQRIAANYIANYFRKNGLDSLNLDGYFQRYTLLKYNYGNVGIMAKNTGKYADKVSYMGFFGTNLFTHEMNFRDTLHFKYLGYGKNYKNLNLKDTVAILLLDDNLGKTYNHVKNIAAHSQGKFFLIFFPKTGLFRYNPEKHPLAEINKNDRLKALTYKFKDPFLPKYYTKYRSYADSLQSFMQNNDTIVMAFANPWETGRLFKMKYKKLQKLEKKVAKGKASRNINLTNDTAICYIKTNKYKLDTLQTENVIGYIEGTDKKDEIIVVSAHYDHVGKRGKHIYFGADDNASGTAAIMEMARAFQKAEEKGIKPRRSLIFVAFSGEEMGLRGSDYFVDHCPVPLENVVLNLNLDMVGRNRENDDKYRQTAYVIANGKHRRFFKRKAKQAGRESDSVIISKHPGFRERTTWAFSSDHFRFKRKNIPIACFFTGLHPDYHTTRDTPDKINYAKLTELTRVGYKMLWEVANTKKKLKVKVKHQNKQNFIEKMMD
ncbi:Arginyl aminopeptidase [Salinivirga cyanobacteriivorans]|uniref:Arginyl aminopeptidase n=1 Tax=Salinivirga cyanobacteriivorans TaxID=1307839 RepID=A0A0S2I0V5_9BACT|nr:M28 family peptidase [Salinivirga cyanobacteriivorans]ALO15926.1 Arginyl aminopeptidase [Salinivirga cyanobacteriivorans]